MAISPNSELVRALLEALGLPRRTKWFELRVAIDEAVTVRCEYLPEPFEIEDEYVDVTSLASDASDYRIARKRLKSILKEFTLQEKKT